MIESSNAFVSIVSHSNLTLGLRNFRNDMRQSLIFAECATWLNIPNQLLKSVVVLVTGKDLIESKYFGSSSTESSVKQNPAKSATGIFQGCRSYLKRPLNQEGRLLSTSDQLSQYHVIGCYWQIFPSWQMRWQLIESSIEPVATGLKPLGSSSKSEHPPRCDKGS